MKHVIDSSLTTKMIEDIAPTFGMVSHPTLEPLVIIPVVAAMKLNAQLKSVSLSGYTRSQ